METTNKKHETIPMQENLQQMLDANIEKLKAMDNAREQTARQLQQVEAEIKQLAVHNTFEKKASRHYAKLVKQLLVKMGFSRLLTKK